MSDIRFNQWLHQSGTGGVSQVDGGHVGIGTTNPDIAVHSANAKKLNVGIITANSVYAGNFYGNGSNLSGLAADKILEGDTKVEVVDSGSQYIVAEVNGSERLRITSAGLFGFNNTSPDGKGIDVLHSRTNGYSGTTDTRGLAHIIARNASDASGRFAAISLVSGGGTQAEGSINLVQTGNYTGDLTFKSRTGATTWTEKLRITSAGKVLIGTNTPQGNANADDLVVSTSGHSGITIRSGTSSNGNIFFADGTSGGDEYRGVIDYNHSSNHMSFSTNAVERLRIDSSGHLLIGTTTAGESGADELTIENLSSDMGITLRTATNRQGTIMFSDSTSGVGQYAGAIQYAHNAHAGADSMKFYTNSTQRMTIQSDGGIDINSTKAFKLHAGSTNDRPSGINGMIRYNTSNNVLEGYINGAWVTIKGTGLAEEGRYTSNPQATADDLYAYWDCDSTSTALAGGDSGQATLYGVSSSGGQISNSWDRGTSATNGVYLTSMPTGNNFTLMFWLMLTDNTIHSSSDGAGIVWLDGDTGSGGTEGSVILGYDGSNGNNLRFGGNGWVNDGTVVFSSFGTTNVWRHMTITRDGSGTTWKFYLDGALVNTRTDSMTVGSSWMLGNYNRIRGNGNTNNHYFRGRFDEIAVWDRTLTATEITKVYDTQYAGTGLL